MFQFRDHGSTVDEVDRESCVDCHDKVYLSVREKDRLGKELAVKDGLFPFTHGPGPDDDGTGPPQVSYEG